MYITEQMVFETEQKFGYPLELQFSFLMKSRYEFDLVNRTRVQKNRVHDATVFAFRDDELAVIKKPVYPQGIYRAPSGGIHPGETLEEGAIRETKEETGLDVVIEKYVVRSRVDFQWEEDLIHWTTHVFTARPLHFRIAPIDKKEISEARFMKISELNDTVRKKMVETGTTGLLYRALLHDAVMNVLRPEAQ